MQRYAELLSLRNSAVKQNVFVSYKIIQSRMDQQKKVFWMPQWSHARPVNSGRCVPTLAGAAVSVQF